MSTTDTKAVKIIHHVERAHSSANGNPAWRVFFTDGDDAMTLPDVMWSYEAQNADNQGVPIEFTFTRGGKIRFGRKVQAFYIRTQRGGTYVGSEGAPELFTSRRDARKRADELQERTPSSNGRLIVSEFKGTRR